MSEVFLSDFVYSDKKVAFLAVLLWEVSQMPRKQRAQNKGLTVRKEVVLGTIG